MPANPRTWGELVAALNEEDARVFNVKFGQSLNPSADINNPAVPYDLAQEAVAQAAKRFLTERGVAFDTTVGAPPAAYTAQANQIVQSGNLTKQDILDLQKVDVGAPKLEMDGRVPAVTDATLHPTDPEPQPDTTPPAAPVLDTPTGGSDNIVTLTGLAEDGATVVVTWPDATTSTTTANAQTGHWTATSTGNQPTGVISVVAKDAANNVSQPATANWTHVAA